MKAYKVNIMPYLNKELKLRLENGADTYPLYFRVTYMRQTTLLRSIQNKRYATLDLDLNEILREIKELEGLIFFLSNSFTEPLNLNGLKDKYILSQQPLIQAFETLFRSKVKINAEKIKDPLLITLNIGEYSQKYPIHLLLTAVELHFPQHTQKLFYNCFFYIEMIDTWKSFFPVTGENQPRIIEFFRSKDEMINRDFTKYLDMKFKDPKKAQKFYLDFMDCVTKYLMQEF
jgi:hypothetical protein